MAVDLLRTLRRRGRRLLRQASRPVHPWLGSIRGVRTSTPVAALTFDDGPDDEGTPRILAALADRGVTATFFVLAGRAAERPELLLRARDAGHEIGIHGDDHSPLIGQPVHRTFMTLRRARRRVEAVIGRPVTLFRPPYGWQDVRSFLAARAAGLEVVAWTAMGEDWVTTTPAEVAARVGDGLEAGGVVLLHERYEPPPDGSDGDPVADLDRGAVVRAVLDAADRRGVRVGTVGSLLAAGQPVRVPWFWRPVP